MTSISTISILFGVLLNIVGLVGFFGTGAAHPTALIPSVMGLLLIICGFLARNEKLHASAIQAALVVGVIGFAATASSFLDLMLVLRKTAGVQSPTIISKSATALLCGLFAARCIQSFVQTRRAR
jgi:hypothetical protein